MASITIPIQKFTVTVDHEHERLNKERGTTFEVVRLWNDNSCFISLSRAEATTLGKLLIEKGKTP